MGHIRPIRCLDDNEALEEPREPQEASLSKGDLRLGSLLAHGSGNRHLSVGADNWSDEKLENGQKSNELYQRHLFCAACWMTSHSIRHNQANKSVLAATN